VTLPSSREGWEHVRVLVVGFGPAGAAAADNLLFLGAHVTALDAEPGDADTQERAELLRTLGADIRLGADAFAGLTGQPDAELVVLTGGAAGRVIGGPVWSDAELAWRLRDPAVPWLVAAGRDHARVARLLTAILTAAGLRAVHAGAGGTSLVEAVMDPQQPAVLAVALDANQLAGATSPAAESAAVLSAEDPALGRAYQGVARACVYDVADPGTERLVMDAEVVEGARAIGITLDTPGVSMLGLVENLLVDRAFIPQRHTSAAELATVADLGPAGADPSYLRAALAAAALARAHGVSQAAVRDGLRAAGAVDSPGDE
jgi:UDP-N-acetylmuramoylalanine--D-glutamate ligase